MTTIQVIHSEYLKELLAQASTVEAIQRYSPPGPIALDAKRLLPAGIVAQGAMPVLGVPEGRRERAGSDLSNAIALYKWLGPLPETVARDERLWAWLAHAVFADYCRARWPIPADPKKAESSILDHWFVKGAGQASLRRQAIARLWWAAHLTYEPWQEAAFHHLKNPDSFVYTRVLLGNQDVYQFTLENSFGNDRRVLISMLEVLRHRQSGHSPIIKSMAKDVNLTARFRQLGVLDVNELTSMFGSYVEGLGKAEEAEEVGAA